MFVLNPDPYLSPSYRISPFATSDVAFNKNLPDNDLIDKYFNDRFEGHRFHYTTSGRSALYMALSCYNLGKEDNISILTTSGNRYISRCVTETISSFCGWSREIQPNTRLILVNHEFGYPYPELKELKAKGFPIIEDCAHSFFSLDKERNIGRSGDFSIYSFPKMFPIQIGGLIVQNLPGNIEFTLIQDKAIVRYVKNVMSYYINFSEAIITKRIENYELLKSQFNELGFHERFLLEDDIIPGVFMFRIEDKNLDLNAMKNHFWAHGIQCSVFYGEDAFFIPVHHKLSFSDTEYFYEVMKSFLKSF